MTVCMCLKLLLLFISKESVAQETRCTPAEELQPHNMTLAVEDNSQKHVFWFKGTAQIALCNRAKCVASQLQSVYSASVVFGQTSTLFISNVTRQNAGTYTCITAINTTCDLKVYARPQTVLCQQTLQDVGVTIVCSVTRIYPNPVCQFIWITQVVENQIRPEQLRYENKTESGDPPYFNVQCRWILPTKDISAGPHHFRVSVYPNVTGRESDSMYGTSNSWKYEPSMATDETFILTNPPDEVNTAQNPSGTENPSDDTTLIQPKAETEGGRSVIYMVSGILLILVAVATCLIAYCCMSRRSKVASTEQAKKNEPQADNTEQRMSDNIISEAKKHSNDGTGKSSSKNEIVEEITEEEMQSTSVND